MTLSENSFKRTSFYVGVMHAAFLVGLFVFSRLHFETPLSPETIVWLDGGGGTGGDGVEAGGGDAGAVPPVVPPRPRSEGEEDALVVPPVNRTPVKTVIRPTAEELAPTSTNEPGKSEIQIGAVKKPEPKKPEPKPKEEPKKIEPKKTEPKPKEEPKKTEPKKPDLKPKEEPKKTEPKKTEPKPKDSPKKPEPKKGEAKPKEEPKKEVKPQVVKSGTKTADPKSDAKGKEATAKAEPKKGDTVAKATPVKQGDGKDVPKATAAGSGGTIAKAVSAGGGIAKATAAGGSGAGAGSGRGGSPGSGGGSGGGQGTGIGKGVGSGREGGKADAPDLGGYYRHIHDRFYQPWEQPKTLVRTGKVLRVLLSLRIARDGEILERKIVESSGNEEMDKSVMTSANKVMKIDRLPEGVKKDPFEISIEFKLDQN